MMKNMTEGKPYKLILAFMIPVLFGGLFQNFYNIVDSMIVGRYIGVEALASVGSTTYLIFFVNGWIMGMTSGFAIMISQRYGAKDEKGLKHYVAMSVWLCVIMSVVLTIVLLIFRKAAPACEYACRYLRRQRICDDHVCRNSGYDRL